LYTVLILSRQAMDSYHEYEPIMSINNYSDSIGVCAWVEGANTIDTAVQELTGKVLRHKEWRAVVVQTELPGSEDSYAVRGNNPFDYEKIDQEKPRMEQLESENSKVAFDSDSMDNKKNKPQSRWEDFPFVIEENTGSGQVLRVKPSDYPMVLISQLLGGIPAKSPDFLTEKLPLKDTEEDKTDFGEKQSTEAAEETVEETTEQKQKRIEFTSAPQQWTVQKQEDEDLRHYKELIEAWNHENCASITSPTEIVLIRRRKVSFVGIENEISTKWHNFAESESSRFWERMGYPNICRFLTFDVDVRGTLRETADMFRFWSGILLLCGNRLNSNILQPYRLYRFDVNLDEERLQSSLQSSVNKLNYAQYCIEQLSANSEQKKNEPEKRKEQPEIAMKVQVNLDTAIGKKGSFSAPDNPPCFSKNKSMDLSEWIGYTERTAESWEDTQTIVRRTVGKAAEGISSNRRIYADQVSPMTEFEKEDLIDELDGYYDAILTEQQDLPALSKVPLLEELQKADKVVQKMIDRRISVRRFALLLTALLAGFSVSIGCAYFETTVLWYVPAAIIIAALLICLFSARLNVCSKKRRLYRGMLDYYGIYRAALNKLMSSGKMLGEFFGHVGSSMRGKSMLFAVESKEKQLRAVVESTNRQLKRFAKAQEVFTLWCAALQIKVDFDDSNAVEEMADNRLSVEMESLVSVDAARDFKIDVNQGSAKVISPYSFISRLIVEREEIYDE